MFHKRRIWMVNLCSRLVLSILILCAVFQVTAQENQKEEETPAQAPDSSDEQLAAIQKEMQALRLESDRLNAQENSILKLLTQFDVEFQLKTHEIEMLEIKQQNTQAQIDAFKQKYDQQQKDLQQQKTFLSHRLVEAYKLGELNYLKLLLRVNKAGDLLRSYQYIAYLARDDSRKVQAYRQSMQSTEETRVRLEQENRNLVLLKQDMEAAHVALLDSRREKMKLLAVVQDQKEMHTDALKELSRAAAQLQDFFTDIEPPAAVPSGIRFTQYRGSLDWPVSGQVIREYGMYRHPKFGTTTMSNGIEISAPEGADVTAVFDGEVVFAEWFKGYGQSIILSHGDGYYSLYAHNSALLVQRHAIVQRGQIISKVGSTGSLTGSGLYFEIRRKDQPINPMEWLRKSSVAQKKQ